MMIRTLKKLTGVLLIVQLLVLGNLATVWAAEAVITFTDLDTQVGEIFTMNCKIDGKGTRLSQANLEMSYDPAYIQFMGGEGIDASVPGKLIYDGSGSGDVLRFSMEFQALQEGYMRMELDQATVTTSAGGQMQVELGYSDVQIAAGDPSLIENMETPTGEFTGEPVGGIIVGDMSYSLSENFSDMDLPMGFVRGTITYNGSSYQGAVQEQGTMQLGYLVNAAQEQNFFIYDDSGETFTYFEQVILSTEAESYIVLLQKDEDMNVPEGFEEVNLTMNSHEFSAWQEPRNLDFYLFFAQNQSGERGFYRYDFVEKTYQRYAMEGSELLAGEQVEEQDEQADGGRLAKLLDYMADHVEQVFIGIILLVVLAVVLLIILGVKLHNRNLELDEFYDEYEIDAKLEEIDQKPATSAVKKKSIGDYDNLDLEDRRETPKKKVAKKPATKRPTSKMELDVPVKKKPARPARRSDTQSTDIEFVDLD
jgi:hypothetical protein